MNAIIDTSSLLALVRNYLPFDQNNKLKNFIQKKYESRELIIIDRVYDESRDIQKGIIFSNLDFVGLTSRTNKPKGVINTDTILPKKAFYIGLENQFCNQDIRKRTEITEAEFEIEKQKFLDGADAKMILYAQHLISDNSMFNSLADNKPIIITEESHYSNDGKYFKKIPVICKIIGIDCCTLPILFKDYYCLNLDKLLS